MGHNLEAADAGSGAEFVSSLLRKMSSTRVFVLGSTVLTLVLFALLPLIDNGSVAVPDEGVYSAQARALAEGSWRTGRPAADVIDDGVAVNAIFDPVGPSKIDDTKRIPYGRHPLYSIVLSFFYRGWNLRGLLLLSILGGLCASIVIGVACRDIRPQWGIFALFLTAISSPLLYNSYVVSAHSWGTAMSALIVLAVLRNIDSLDLKTLPLGAIGSAILPMLRTEGVVLIAATTIALFLFSVWNWWRYKAIVWSPIVLALVVGIFGLIGWLIDLHWTRNILGPTSNMYTEPGKAILGEQTTVFHGIWIALFQPWFDPVYAQVAVPLVGAIFVVAIVLWRIIPHRPVIPLVLLGGAAIAGMTMAVTTDGLVTGLFAAWPLAAFSMIWLTAADVRSDRVRILFLILLIASIGLAATIYGDGGSTQWGGRLFQILLPLLIPLVVYGISNALRSLERRSVKLAALGLLIIVSVSFGVTSLRPNYRLRREADIFVKEITQSIIDAKTRPPHAGVTNGVDRDLVAVYNPVPDDGTARVFWKSDLELNMVSVGWEWLPKFLRAVDFRQHDVLILTGAGEIQSALLVDSIEKELAVSVEWLPPPPLVPVTVLLLHDNGE